MEDPAPAPPPTPKLPGCLKWGCITIIALAAIGSIAAVNIWNLTLNKVKETATAFAARPDKFESTQISHTFHEQLASISPTHGDVLEVATAERDETLTKYDMKSLLFNTVYLGTTISEVRVRATYRYHIKIGDEWKVGRQGSRCIVIAPVIRPSLPAAIHSDTMSSKTTSGWLRFNGTSNLEELQKSVTPMVSELAGNARHIKEVREPSRKAVAEFVRNWLIKEDQWKASGMTDVVVVFADEPAGKSLEEAGKEQPVANLVP